MIITYDFYVTALWDEGESDPSNTHTVEVIVGIEEILFNSTQVFPNPATDVVNIESDFTIESVTVYNHAGQIVVNQEVNSKLFKVNTSQYQSGIYFLQIETKEGQISKRVIIKYADLVNVRGVAVCFATPFFCLINIMRGAHFRILIERISKKTKSVCKAIQVRSFLSLLKSEFMLLK